MGHYRLARRLGQLGALRVCAAPAARDIYYEYFAGKGMKWGDIKDKLLIRDLADAAQLLALPAAQEIATEHEQSTGKQRGAG